MRVKTILTTLLITFLLVVGVDYVSYAATGGHALLGKINKAGAATTFKRTTAGPAVNLSTKTSGSAPLATNGRGKVANLNADLLDGRDSSSFASRQTTRVLEMTATTPATEHNFSVGSLPPGKYLATYSVFMEGTFPQLLELPTGGGCHFDQTLGSAPVVHHKSVFAWSTTVDDDGGSDLAVSGAGVVDTASGNNLTLRCSSTKQWTTGTSATNDFGPVPAQITLTRLESTTVSTGTAD